METYSTMNLTELKAEVKKRGLPVSGTKEELITRLENYQEETTEEELEKNPKKQKTEEPIVSPKKVFPIFAKGAENKKPEITIKEGKTEVDGKTIESLSDR
jgi:hypothetical protein